MNGLGKRCDRCSEERGSRAGMVKVWLAMGGGDLGQKEPPLVSWPLAHCISHAVLGLSPLKTESPARAGTRSCSFIFVPPHNQLTGPGGLAL